MNAVSLTVSPDQVPDHVFVASPADSQARTLVTGPAVWISGSERLHRAPGTALWSVRW